MDPLLRVGNVAPYQRVLIQEKEGRNIEIFIKKKGKLNSDIFKFFLPFSVNLLNNGYILENFKRFYDSLTNFSVIGPLDQKLQACKMVTQQKKHPVL